MNIKRILFGAAAIAMGLGAAVASAGAASAASGTLVFTSGDTVFVSAATGKANNISVRLSGTNILVKDTGDVMIAASGCKAAGAEVSCPAANIARVQVETFDNADFVAVNIPTMRTTIRGGAGDDSLFGAAKNVNQIFGEGGKDLVAGGDVFDNLRGGDGDDRLFGFAGDDFIVGDAGYDRAFGGAGIDECIAEEDDCEA